MLHYLKIFSWFLFTFGVVGLLAVLFGLDVGIGRPTRAGGLLAGQLVVSTLILAGFRLYNTGAVERRTLLYGGWALIGAFVLTGQIWLNAG